MPTSHKLQTKSNFAQQMMQILRRPVGASECKAPPDFGRKTICTHHIATIPPPPIFRPSYGPTVSMTAHERAA